MPNFNFPLKLIVVGISHKTAPVGTREKFSFLFRQITEVNQLLKKEAFLAENLVLSTCNRVEIYAVSNQEKDCAGKIKNFLCQFHHLNLQDHENVIYTYRGEEAVKHLLTVAAGLDSMVVGEAEILGQVKQAYRDAQESRTVGRVLKRLLEKSFNTAKKIKTDTLIGRGNVSVGSVTVVLAKKILGGLTDRKVLIIGAGSIGEQLVLYLKQNEIKSILVTNRTMGETQSLAARFAADCVPFENFRDRLVEVDIVIASTGAPHCLIRRDDILALMPKRKQNPLFLIDLAVPRNVEETVSRIDNVYLYNIDDLQKIVDENIKMRKNELEDCSKIITAATERFMKWFVGAHSHTPSVRREAVL